MAYSELILVILGIIIGFFVLYFLNKAYLTKIRKINPVWILIIGYILLVLNMVLQGNYYSVEWALLGFILVTTLFYDSKIDSRFLILPALILLGYLPFLLIGAQKELAEKIAVYVYYFLVVGVVLQIIEYKQKTVHSLDFNSLIKTIINKERILSLLSIWGVITLAVIVYNRFSSVELLKWSSVYVFVLILVFYAIAHFQEQKECTPELEQK